MMKTTVYLKEYFFKPFREKEEKLFSFANEVDGWIPKRNVIKN